MRGVLERLRSIIAGKPRETRSQAMATRWFAAGMNAVLLADFDVDVGEAANVSAIPSVRRAWQKVALDMARCRVRVVDADGVSIENHPALSLLTRSTGTAGLSPRRWRVWESVACQQHGNAYTLVHRTPNGTPYRLEPLAPGQVEVSVSEEGVRYAVNGHEVDEANLIAQQWDADANMPFSGLAPMDTCRDTMRTQAAVCKGWRRVVNTGMVGKWSVTKENALSPRLLEEIETKWDAKHTLENLDKPAIFQEGLKQNPFIADAAARFMDARREGIKDVALMTDLPPAMLYEQDGRAMGEVAQLYASDLAARLEVWADEWTRKLCSVGETIHLSTGALALADYRTGYRGVSMAYERGILSTDEARERLGGLADLPNGEGAARQVLISGVTGQPEAADAEASAEGAMGEGENGGEQ
jgi:HK97 family phage portal protein